MTDVALDEIDLASGMVLGSVTGAEGWPAESQRESARQAIEAAILEALLRPPCLVSFSGGRDSSALLAVAVQLAAREGLPTPVPVTVRFADERSQEDEWQESVIRHLGVDEWHKLPITSELDLLADIGTSILRRHGVRYPPNVHFQVPLLRLAPGGSLVSGAGGDELMQPHRWARAGLVVRGAVRPRPVDALVVAVAYSPRPVRTRMHAGRSAIAPPWLTVEGRQSVRRRQLEWVAGDRVRYDEHLEWWHRSRYLTHGQHSLELVARDHDVMFVAPFSDVRVMAALARDRRGVGFPSRTEAMRDLFGGVLPERTISRSSKASFSNPLIGPTTREFVADVDPSRFVPEALVDADTLRAVWQEDFVDIRSLPMLQTCWLAAN